MLKGNMSTTLKCSSLPQNMNQCEEIFYESQWWRTKTTWTSNHILFCMKGNNFQETFQKAWEKNFIDNFNVKWFDFSLLRNREN